MLKKALHAAFLAAALPASAAASDKDQQSYDAMVACFSEKANSLDDLTTPIDDLADVVIGMCWDRVNQHRARWTDDWGVQWAAFVGPYFNLQVTSKAKEAVYTSRMIRRQKQSG